MYRSMNSKFLNNIANGYEKQSNGHRYRSQFKAGKISLYTMAVFKPKIPNATKANLIMMNIHHDTSASHQPSCCTLLPFSFTHTHARARTHTHAHTQALHSLLSMCCEESSVAGVLWVDAHSSSGSQQGPVPAISAI